MSKRPSSLLCCSLSSGISSRLTLRRLVQENLRSRRTLVRQGAATVRRTHHGDFKGVLDAGGEGDDCFRITSSKRDWAAGRSLSDFKATAASPRAASFLSVAFSCGATRLARAIAASK